MSVNPFPNVPFAPGVPSVARVATGALSLLNGQVAGVVDQTSRQFTGSFDGVAQLASGPAGFITGTLAGVVDPSGQLSATLASTSLGGDVLGTLAGFLPQGVGAFTGALTATIANMRGTLPFAGLDGAGETSAEEFEWGIFGSDDGAAVVVGDSVFAFDGQGESRISTYPLEEGGFSSYNKVLIPFDIRLTFTKGGSIQDKADFLQAIDDAKNGVDLYEVRTPEKTYLDVNVIHWAMRRTAEKGAQLLTVDVDVQQVRTTAESQFVPTQTDAGSAPVNIGPQQPQTPTVAQSATISGVQ